MPRYRSRVRASYPAPLSKGKPQKGFPFSLVSSVPGHGASVLPDTGSFGAVAKRLCTGLQIRPARFDSGPRLQTDESPIRVAQVGLFCGFSCVAPSGLGRASTAWCPEPGSNRHAAFQQAADFKSAVSTDFTIGAWAASVSRSRQDGSRHQGDAPERACWR